jgi:hypothetical protein
MRAALAAAGQGITQLGNTAKRTVFAVLTASSKVFSLYSVLPEKSLCHISKYAGSSLLDSGWLTQVQIPKELAMTEQLCQKSHFIKFRPLGLLRPTSHFVK